MDTNYIDANCLQSLCELESVWADMETMHGEYLGDSFWNISQAILAGRRFEKMNALKAEQIAELRIKTNALNSIIDTCKSDLADKCITITKLCEEIDPLITPEALAVVQKAVGVTNNTLKVVEGINAEQAERIIQLTAMISKKPENYSPGPN